MRIVIYATTTDAGVTTRSADYPIQLHLLNTSDLIMGAAQLAAAEVRAQLLAARRQPAIKPPGRESAAVPVSARKGAKAS